MALGAFTLTKVNSMNSILADLFIGQGIFGLSPMSIVLILVVVVLLFGAKRLPELFGSLGKSVSAFKQGKEEGLRELEEMKTDAESVADEVKTEVKSEN